MMGGDKVDLVTKLLDDSWALNKFIFYSHFFMFKFYAFLYNSAYVGGVGEMKLKYQQRGAFASKNIFSSSSHRLDV